MPFVPLEIKAFDKVAKFALDLDQERPGEENIHNWLASGKLYDPDVSFVLLRVLNAGDSVADVGGHVGYFTLLSAARWLDQWGKFLPLSQTRKTTSV